jgi:DNA replication protein DnaC
VGRTGVEPRYIVDTESHHFVDARSHDFRFDPRALPKGSAEQDDLARSLVIARGDSIKHQAMLNEYSAVNLLLTDDFMTVGIDPDAAADLFTILANREHRAATVIASQSGPDYWVDVLPDKVAADSIVNRLVNHAKKITLGEVDMRAELSEQARQTAGYWE